MACLAAACAHLAAAVTACVHSLLQQQGGWRRQALGHNRKRHTKRTHAQIVKVFIDNPFPIPLIAHGCGVRCLDVSPGRGQLALVDEQSKVVVYDLESKVSGAFGDTPECRWE